MVRPLLLMLLLSPLAGCLIDAPTCGNGQLDPGEACDGIYFASDQRYSCSQLGYNGTTLAGCTAGCAIDPTPCEPTGRCGDGVVAPGYEECDGDDFGDEDCVSLGYHGGSLACTSDCGVDILGCARCGDGIVQETAGELMESNVTSCLDDGFFGGFLHTADCVVPTEEICGDFALVPSDSSVFDPVFAQAADGTVHLTGMVSGTFPGYENPGCPREKDLYVTWVDDLDPYQEHVGTYHDPACAMEFSALRAPGQVERVVGQQAADAPVAAMTAFGDAGVVRLRRGDPHFVFELVDAGGGARFSTSLGMLGIGHLPRLVRLDAAVAGVSAVDHAGIHFARVDLLTGAFSPLGFAAEIWLDSRYQFDVYQDHAASWNGPDEVFFVAALTPWESGQGGKKALFHGRQGETGWTLERLFTLDGVIAASVRQFTLDVSVDEDRVEVAWIDDEASLFHRADWSLAGDPGSHQIVNLPATHHVEALHRASDGSHVLGGFTWMAPETNTAANLCRASGSSLMLLRVETSGALAARYFLTTAVMGPNFDFDFCHFNRRHYSFDGATLLVGGAYDRSAGFCTDGEVPPATRPLPLHACGIYLVRMEVP